MGQLEDELDADNVTFEVGGEPSYGAIEDIEQPTQRMPQLLMDRQPPPQPKEDPVLAISADTYLT